MLPGTGEDECIRNNLLSISVEQSGIIRVPFDVLKQMFQKAGVHLSRGKEAIVTAPGANAFPEHYVESRQYTGCHCILQLVQKIDRIWTHSHWGTDYWIGYRDEVEYIIYRIDELKLFAKAK